jgi:flagellar basal-body rod protein FlgF
MKHKRLAQGLQPISSKEKIEEKKAMSGAIYQAAAGALIQQMRLEILTNNLANVNTTGYKADIPVFRLPKGQATGQATSAPAIPGGMTPYAPPLEARTDFEAGPFVRTGNDLDVAIQGRGFFEIQAPDGPRFTRKGNFTINAQGALATTEGWPVMGKSGPITIDGSRIDINNNGDVSVDGNLVDSLRVVDFDQPGNLSKTGGTFFVPAQGVQGRTLAEGSTQIAQGFLETSNVNAIRTMTELIETMRVFESYQRVIRTADEATDKTVNEVGRSV